MQGKLPHKGEIISYKIKFEDLEMVKVLAEIMAFAKAWNSKSPNDKTFIVDSAEDW